MKRINKNLSGNKFGSLKVLRFVEMHRGRSFYECQCDCGNVVIKNAKYLCCGDTTSCGCLKIKNAITNAKNGITHGLSKHPLYKVWASLKDRCFNEKCHCYSDYGGRGITVSDEWLSFQTFYNDVIGTYKKGLELDRRDNDGNYCKENFRWATPTVNKRNRRTSVYLTVNGITKHIAEWSSEYGISRHSIFSRIVYEKLNGELALYGIRKLNKIYGKEKVHQLLRG